MDMITQTAQQISSNKDAISDVQNQTSLIKTQQNDLQNALRDLKNLSEMKTRLGDLKHDQKQQQANELEWAKMQAQIQMSQMDHDIKLNQIQSAIAIAEIKAKGQAYNVNSQYELGIGKLKLEEWKTELQNVLSKETLYKSHEHQYKMLQIQAEIDSQKDKHKQWYASLEKDRERKFMKELEQSRNEQTLKLDHLEKDFRFFQDTQRQDHDYRLKERDEKFQTDMLNIRNAHNVLIETNKQTFAQVLERDRNEYKANMLQVKQHFSSDMQRQRNNFEMEIEEKRQTSSALLAKQKETMEKYKTDLMASIKTRQIEKQDENEKLKLELKMDEYRLKLQDSLSKNSTNKYQFKLVPQPISSFEFQIEKSAETVPYSVIRTFEQLWNTMFEFDMGIKRVLKYKKELASVSKKAVENHSAFIMYLTEDLEDTTITRRYNYCQYFERVGMFLFKTGPPFNFTKHPLKSNHTSIIESSIKKRNELVIPRYVLTEDGQFIIDLFEYISKQLVFPSNASYNVNVYENFSISYKNESFECPEIINDIFLKHSSPIFTPTKSSDSKSTSATMTSDTNKPRRSTPIFVSDQQVKIPCFANKNNVQTRIQVFM